MQNIAVTVGKEIIFLSNNASMTGRVINHDANELTAIAYDDVTRTMYLGDKKNNNTSIFYKNLNTKDINWNRLLKAKNQDNHIVGLYWDYTSKNIIYMDSIERSIMKIDSTTLEPIEIIKLPNTNLRGLAIDTCSRKFYWSSSDKLNPSISSCNYDGSNIKMIIKTNLYDPSALTIDQTDGKIYWADDEEGIHYKIESSDLDGKNRKIIFSGRNHQPVSISLDFDYIYWTDWTYSAIWRIKKNTQIDDKLIQWKTFYDLNIDDGNPISLLTRDNIHSLNCQLRDELNDKSNVIKKINNTNQIEGLVTSAEDKNNNENSGVCLNEGKFMENSKICLCKNGFIGDHCEISVCWNYCFQGECIITGKNKPQCNCPPMFTGPRCQQNICTGYCLNDGKCSVKNGEPFCDCTDSNGTRCEIKIHDNCQNYCANDTNNINNTSDAINTPCRCPKINDEEISHCTYEFWNNNLITILSVIIGALSILIITLGLFINKLRQRPRIKKRFIVSKNGITPLTTRPELPRDQCEIMIENCCNMNICETPCFEPQTRSDTKKSKKEEKHSLLDSMDGNNSC
ncbi:hypothetical protein HCN44_001542 [Aphidius gifuensis]|uniref:EGF-like domain-containing protein n=1 Tax=Aphidius gifuensis TaxID=684658 RepID=A0A834XTC5_APHGI|nr:hypothetical protein HCN44_001542 [Aphidius gifuensis]